MSGSRRPEMGGFKEFLLKTNALALAIGVVIGVALGAVVNSLVNDIIMPPIGVRPRRRRPRPTSRSCSCRRPAAIRRPRSRSAGDSFINALISFIIIALVVYLISKMFIKEAEPDPTKACPFCFEANHVAATKCRACASPI